MGRIALLALAASAVIVTACAEKFVSPDKPDLYKVPYDFAATAEHPELGDGEDLSASHPDDLAHEEHD